MPKLSEMKSVTFWFEPGVENGHVSATIARMQELCTLGFNGSFNIIYIKNERLSGPKAEMDRAARGEDYEDPRSVSFGVSVYSRGEYTEPGDAISKLEAAFPGRIGSFMLHDDDSLSNIAGRDELCISAAADQTSEAPIEENQISFLRAQLDRAFGCEVMIQLQPPNWLAGQSYIKKALSEERTLLPLSPHKIDHDILAGFEKEAVASMAAPPLRIGCYGLAKISQTELRPSLVSLFKNADEPIEIHEVGNDASGLFITRGKLDKKDMGKLYSEVDLMICEGQNTANECLVLGVPVLHLPSKNARNIYPSEAELLTMGFHPERDQNVFGAVRAMNDITQLFLRVGSSREILSSELKSIRKLVDRDALFQLADKINTRPSPLESALYQVGIKFGVEQGLGNVVETAVAPGENIARVMRGEIKEGRVEHDVSAANAKKVTPTPQAEGPPALF